MPIRESNFSKAFVSYLNSDHWTSVKLAPYSTMLTSVSYLTEFYRSDLDNFYTIR